MINSLSTSFCLGVKFQEIHIGNRIRQRLDETGMSYNEFADRLCCQRNSLYYIFNQKSMDVEKLARISSILNYDFLRLYSSDGIDSEIHDTESFLAVVKITSDNIDSFLRDYPSAVIINTSK